MDVALPSADEQAPTTTDFRSTMTWTLLIPVLLNSIRLVDSSLRHRVPLKWEN